MKKIAFIILLFLSLNMRGETQETPFYFSTINLKDGLSQLSVLKIFQDKNGFMWFGTRNGLNRYDGTAMKVYKHSSDNPNSLSNNHIKTIAEDGEGNLWIGMINGISRLDTRTGRIVTYRSGAFEGLDPQKNVWVNDLLIDRANRLWVVGQGGVFVYHPERDLFERFAPQELAGHNYFVKLYLDGQENLLIGGGTGLFIFDKELRFVVSYHKDGTEAGLTDNDVSAIYESESGCYWIGTREQGLNRVDHRTGRVTRFTSRNSSLGNDHIRDITLYKGRIVVGSRDGLIWIDPSTYLMERYTNYDEKKGGLSHFSVYSLFVDNSGTLWVGTYSGGVNYYNPLNNRFGRLDPKQKSDVFFGIFGAMDYQADRHTLWIASEGGGLLALDLQNRLFRNYLLEPRGQMMNDNNIIKSVRVEGDTVWCGTQRGTIYTFDTRSNRFSLFYNFHENISIYKTERVSDGSIWATTTGNRAFVQFRPDGRKAGSFETDVEISSARCFLEIRENVFLIGTHLAGLILYDKNSRETTRYNPRLEGNRYFPGEYVTGILPDASGQYWIATHGGGLCLFDEQKGVTGHFTVKDGLADDNILALVWGNDNQLWMSTGQGISSLNRKTCQFTNFTDRNEIGSNEFTMLGGVSLPNGDIYFSGSEEILVFNPRKLIRNKEIPPVVLTSLTVNNEPVRPGEESSLLKEDINHVPEIVLQAHQNNFSIGYMALNYLFPYQNRYAYKLEGYDREWNDVGNRKEAFYTNLKPGKYLFHVKASNNDGVWNEQGRSVALHILTPLWLKPYAIALYVFLFLSITYFFYYYLHKKRQLERDLQEKQKEQERQEEFHQSKIRMFTNFSHELRTPLTLILSPLEEMLQRVELGSGMKKSLQLVYGNAQRLLLLVNQLMDLRKNQAGSMQLRVSKDNLYLFVQEIYIAFNQIAEKNRIRFHLDAPDPQIEGWFDRSLMEKVLFNLLSNAFKHTHPGESVTVGVRVFKREEVTLIVPDDYLTTAKGDRFASLKVEDIGDGISDDEKQYIFSPFYQGRNEQDPNITGTGIGLSLVLSIVKLHQGVIWLEDNSPKGTIFRVVIPIDRAVYKENEVVEEEHPEWMLSGGEETREIPDWIPLKQRYQILLAEDNAEVRAYVKQRLEPYFDVLEADNGVAALEKITETLPDLVISDIMMPQMDGLTLCSTIKQDLRTSHIPVIIITAKSMVIHIKEGYQSGADDYIVKPFNMEELLYRVRARLEHRERLKELYSKTFSFESLGIEMSSADDRFMRKFFEVIEKNITNAELNVDLICQEIGIGRTSFYRKMKAITHLSPIELIRKKRLEIAARLLLETDMSVSEISYQVGFNSNTYFTTCFKDQYSVSPTEYVQMQKGGG